MDKAETKEVRDILDMLDMNAQEVDTFTATIYVGSYVNETKKTIKRSVVEETLKAYCDSVGFCVTLTDTQFIYSEGSEPGFIVGLINYPRFPKTKKDIMEHAFVIAFMLKTVCKQQRVSFVTDSKTYMLSDKESVDSLPE